MMTMDLTRRQALAAAVGSTSLAISGWAPSVHAELPAKSTSGDHRLWYRLPADIPREALVIGNGRLGAMIAGQPRDEVIPLNEDTLWSGQPRDWNPPNCRDTLAGVRAAVFAEDYAKADTLTKRMQGPFSDSYAPLATLRLTFDHDGPVEDYVRALDLDAATATVSYSVGGVHFTREIFASHPAQLILMRLRANRPGALSLRIALDSLIRFDAAADPRGITLTGKAPTYCAPNYLATADPVIYSDRPGLGMAFATRLELLGTDGRVTTTDGTLSVRGASELVFAVSASTGFLGSDRAPDLPAPVVLANALKPLAAARGATFDVLHAEHQADHRAFYRRLSLRLGNSVPSEAPTNERLAANSSRPEPALAALYANFARYLLIASSRPGTQAANLQGIWSWEMRPPWSCNYTTNINIQQNYWGAEAGNLAELHTPMIDFIEEVARTGAGVAKAMYGLDGWCVHHNSDLWRLASPVGMGEGGPTWANFILAGPWLARHVWEHYLYSLDRKFLAKRGYPLLKGCAEFCAGWLVRDPRDGLLTTAPSVSTENSFTGPDGKVHAVSAGCTMDIAMIRELFGFTADAATVLGVDAAFARRLIALAGQLPPYRIGRFGQLQEWEKDFVEPEPQQRHISHLYTVTPGWQVTPRATPDLAKAAHVAMTRRIAAGGAETGWGRAWAIHVFARLGDAERAHDNFNALLQLSTGATMLDVLPSANGPLFQIDGNFAGGAAVIEMIVQSHADVIAFLPAIPAAWSEGELSGVRVRGGASLDMTWRSGRMDKATFTASADTELTLRAPTGQRIAAVRRAGAAQSIERTANGDRVRLRKGQVYAVDFA